MFNAFVLYQLNSSYAPRMSIISLLQACPPLSNPGNGTVSVEDGTEFEDEAIYTCGEGYELVGSNHRVCGSDGSWTSTEPMCVFIGRLILNESLFANAFQRIL